MKPYKIYKPSLNILFQIRTTKRVAMWPVGLCTKFGLSSPVVSNGSFVGFYDGWVAGRKFPVDMAGFAVSVEFLLMVSIVKNSNNGPIYL